jgi:hypothetical protein
VGASELYKIWDAFCLGLRQRRDAVRRAAVHPPQPALPRSLSSRTASATPTTAAFRTAPCGAAARSPRRSSDRRPCAQPRPISPAPAARTTWSGPTSPAGMPASASASITSPAIPSATTTPMTSPSGRRCARRRRTASRSISTTLAARWWSRPGPILRRPSNCSSAARPRCASSRTSARPGCSDADASRLVGRRPGAAQGRRDLALPSSCASRPTRSCASGRASVISPCRPTA